MASLAVPLPFAQVEESVEFVSLAVRIAHRRNAVRAWLCKLHLTFNLHEIVTLQEDVIKKLNDGCVNRFSPEQLLYIATKIEELVAICESKLAIAQQENFLPWQGYLQKISEQAECLDSIAETFKESVSKEYTAYIGGLVESAASNQSKKVESWSEFVASLHD